MLTLLSDTFKFTISGKSKKSEENPRNNEKNMPRAF